MKKQSLIELVEELLSLNDANLADRVLQSNDVQWCLSELSDYIKKYG